MITANVFERVVKVVTKIDTGTGFTIDRADRQFLITAAHLLPNHSVVAIDCEFRGQSVRVEGSPLRTFSPDADTAVIPLERPITQELPLPATSDGMVFGQAGYFLGFPLGLGFTIGPGAEFPLVKGCLISGQIIGPEPGRRVLLLDGSNNFGFSGGPVVLRAAEQPGREMQVVAVISGWWPEDVGQPEGWKVRANSGIITATPIEAATEAIDAWLKTV